ncbi:MAG: hypothetical protein R6V85_12420 [Polyangia bacterium]
MTRLVEERRPAALARVSRYVVARPPNGYPMDDGARALNVFEMPAALGLETDRRKGGGSDA